VSQTCNAKDDPRNRVVWIDRGWQPVEIGFCPSKAAWKHHARSMGLKDLPYPTNAATSTRFTKPGADRVIVTLGKQADEPGRSRVEIAGLLCHEATHVWQAVREAMNDPGQPSVEFEAYAMQAIFQGLYQAWLDTRAPPELLARGATREVTTDG
jgi:hypothetical protein